MDTLNPKPKTPRHARWAFYLALLLPVYFAIAAFGTKFGLWSWQTGLMSLTFGAGMFLVPIVAGLALLSLLLVVIRKPRKGWIWPVLGMAIPAAFALFAVIARSNAAGHPIHDVATDTGNPPVFSEQTMLAREEAGANPVSDYQTPLGELSTFEGIAPEMAIQSHAQVITEYYANLAPLPLGSASRKDAIAAVAAAMDDMGMENIRTDIDAGRVEGVAETFWFGFKDDVVARVGDTQIDFRSVSRVGRSDLGANSKRIKALREATAARIGQR
ncbi:DUF1499 domain-containing protein [Erythrobacter sp. YT30]|uniref:DUF1499 domain-containing protein n=1 Tax=Erythrobacter sp. YT30 TaxID=1735012 RepID=UPI00076DA780|nr:DUF1499 domain-containing protein [Erythrobacter sp. YT30]KWV90919.1 hypothetical protein AUC45_06170 [Erythrobacter sp. YT30]